MKNNKIIILSFFVIALLGWGCTNDFLNTNPNTKLTQSMINTDYSKIWDFGYAPYTYLSNGFNSIDGNISAAISDEAEQTSPSSNAQMFNNGSWSAYNNPMDVYSTCYKGIRAASYFLENFTNYRTFLTLNRDTLSDNQVQYKKDVLDIQWMRAEARVLRAWYYFELLKRYGDVPLIKKVLSTTDSINVPRAKFDDVINYAISEIDLAKDSLQPNWNTSAFVNNTGRLDKGVALAIKSRLLLYAASPLHNSSNDPIKWQKAAAAANDVIALGYYSLDTNYQNIFYIDNTVKSKETIWAIRLNTTNTLEKQNYPVGTVGGNSGVTPSQNLVDDYEYKTTPDPKLPYKNKDPRLGLSVVLNATIWNGRVMQIYAGGIDGIDQKNATKTGYYLKKFLSPNLDLVNNVSMQRSWIVFRYAEILLNYAEAMNEAYGPDNNNGYSMTARQAINAVRSRPGVLMPAVVATNYTDMQTKIKHECRIELAFEDHRYWDLLRWKDAQVALNAPLMGMSAVKNPDNTYTYTTFKVEDRVFDASKMYYFPIPQSEIVKSNGILIQNPNW